MSVASRLCWVVGVWQEKHVHSLSSSTTIDCRLTVVANRANPKQQKVVGKASKRKIKPAGQRISLQRFVGAGCI